MNIEIVHSLAEADWRQFVGQHPHGNIFHTPEMFEVFHGAKGYKPELWAAVLDEQVISLFVPVQISLANGFFQSYTTRNVSFGGVLCRVENDSKEALKKILYVYSQKITGNPLFTELRNQNDLGDIQPVLQACGFGFEGHLNYLINLDQSDADIWKGFSKSIRKHIHAAQKKNLMIHEVTDRFELPVVYNLLKQAYRRIRIPFPDLSFFEAAFDILLPKKVLKIYLLKAEDIYISTRLVLTYKDRITDWYTGSDRSFAKDFPEEFIIWHILQWSKLHGYRIFDFGGAGAPDENYGPRVFEEKFGGVLINNGRNVFIHAPARLKFSKFGYKIFRNYLRIPFTIFNKTH